MAKEAAITKLADMPLGGRLLTRSRKDWRFAAVSRIAEEKITLTVASPSGRTYRLWKTPDTAVVFEGILPILKPDETDEWRENFSPYDRRW